MNLKNISKRIEDGTVTIEPLGEEGRFRVTEQRWDPLTGQETTPEISEHTVDGIEKDAQRLSDEYNRRIGVLAEERDGVIAEFNSVISQYISKKDKKK